MNLVEDPWIPVLFADGSSGSVSLREAFSQGWHIADLSVRPHADSVDALADLYRTSGAGRS